MQHESFRNPVPTPQFLILRRCAGKLASAALSCKDHPAPDPLPKTGRWPRVDKGTATRFAALHRKKSRFTRLWHPPFCIGTHDSVHSLYRHRLFQRGKAVLQPRGDCASSLVGFGATKCVFVIASSFPPQPSTSAATCCSASSLLTVTDWPHLMIEHGMGVCIARTVEVKRLDEDSSSGSEVQM